jgi:5-methylcytosine-specific restriction endonuclease McrA
MSLDSKRLVQKLIERDGNRCHYCGIEMVPNPFDGTYLQNAISVDHVVPRKEGGSSRLENLVLACRRCNRSKMTKSYQEFKQGMDVDATILFLMGLNE